MPFFNHNTVTLHYEIHGEGHPILLLHGGAINFDFNYALCGWVQRLCSDGAKVIGLDFRGHGKSTKLYDPSDYGTLNLADDVRALLDHLHIDGVSVVGYSLGSLIALQLLVMFPERISKACLVATGDGLMGIPPYTFNSVLPHLIDVLARPTYPDDLPKHIAAFWNFVKDSGGDRKAITACAMADYPPMGRASISTIPAPVLVISGECDPILGQGSTLARAFPHGNYIEVTGADHFDLAMNTNVQDAVSEFLLGRKHSKS